MSARAASRLRTLSGASGIVLAAALAVTVSLLIPDVALAAVDGPGAPRRAELELSALADRATHLQTILRREERAFESTCDAHAARSRLIGVRDEATEGIRRLSRLWREGRLRDGGLAVAEVLVHDLVTILTDARHTLALADPVGFAEPGHAPRGVIAHVVLGGCMVGAASDLSPASAAR